MIALIPIARPSAWLPIETLDYPTICELAAVDPGTSVSFRVAGWWREAVIHFEAGSVIGLRTALSMAVANKVLKFRPLRWKLEPAPSAGAIHIGFRR